MIAYRPRALVLSAALIAGAVGATVSAAQTQPPYANDPSDQEEDGQPYQDDQRGAPPPPASDYGQNDGRNDGQNGGPPAYAAAPPPPPPAGYDGSQPPPPPPGYRPGAEDAGRSAQDQQYAAYAQQWEQAYCVRAHANTGAGAVLGGAAGALLGSGLAGRHDRGAGALLGAGVGALGGAAVANNSAGNATSPGCPPGYVTREGAPPLAYGAGYPAAPAYAYAAPDWYQPWVYYGGAWAYRPYPYHAWYYRHYYRPGAYYGRPGRYYGRRRW